MLHFRATEAWFSWLDEIFLQTHRNRSQVLGLAVTEAAEVYGWKKPPDRLPPDRRSAAKAAKESISDHPTRSSTAGSDIAKKAKTAKAGG
jgi:hypothetical protein